MNLKRMLEPAFNDRNYNISWWAITAGIVWVLYFSFPYPSDLVFFDPSREMAIADAKLRDVVMDRMREACFTESEIKKIWYDWGYVKEQKKLIVMIRGREALCGGRGLCGCKTKEERQVSA